MAMNRDEILDAAMTLPVDDRAIVANRLLDSLTEGEQPVDAAWIREIERRIAAYDRGEVAAIPIEDVKRMLREKRRSA